MQLGGVSPVTQLRLNVCPLLLVRIPGVQAFFAQPFCLLLQTGDPCTRLLCPPFHCCKTQCLLRRLSPDITARFIAAILTHLPQVELPEHCFRTLAKIRALLTLGLQCPQDDFERPRHPTHVILVGGPAPPGRAPIIVVPARALVAMFTPLPTLFLKNTLPLPIPRILLLRPAVRRILRIFLFFILFLPGRPVAPLSFHIAEDFFNPGVPFPNLFFSQVNDHQKFVHF